MFDDWVQAFTDGACRGNPGPGGWGVLLRWREHEKELCGGEPHTTNNRMELLAAIIALESIKRPLHVEIITDSQYVRSGITEWLPNWKRNNFHRSDRTPVKNRDLWERLDQACQRHLTVQWQWVKGHAGHSENERADRLANLGVEHLFNQGAEQDEHTSDRSRY